VTPEERAIAIATAFGPGTRDYTYLGIHFQVGNVSASGSAVIATIAAWTGSGGNRVDLPTDNPYVFVNPPLSVPDGGTTITNDPHGNPHTVATFTRNDLVAAQQMVYDTVTMVAKRLGWIP
jgi:hypothetical protein